MAEVKAIIDGKEVSAPQGVTILYAAQEAGIHIPSLCRHPDLRPTGVCRVCVVEVEGARTLVGSCHTPLAEGMVIHTDSPKVQASRQVTVELLLAGHTGPCVEDAGASGCELHQLAAQIETGPPQFRVRKPRFYPIENLNPYLHRDLSRCILCRRCVSACKEVAKKDILSIGYRGINSKVVVDFDDALDKEECKDCGICVDYCPTTALIKTQPAERAGDAEA